MRVFKSDYLFHQSHVCDLGHALWHVSAYVLGFELKTGQLIAQHNLFNALPADLVLDECLPKAKPEVLAFGEVNRIHMGEFIFKSNNFMPLKPDGPLRMQYFGKVNKQYSLDHYPAYPPDLDHRYFQMASSSNWLKREPKPLARVMIDGVKAILPSSQLRLFRPDYLGQLIEQETHCDTLWLFPKQSIGALVWRCISDTPNICGSNIPCELALLEDAHQQRPLDEIQSNWEHRQKSPSDYALVQNDLMPLSMVLDSAQEKLPQQLEQIKKERDCVSHSFESNFNDKKKQEKHKQARAIKLAKAKPLNFAGEKVNNAIFAGKALPGCDFTGAHFSEVDFTGANLQKAVFKNATFDHCTFDEANLEQAVFSSSYFEDCYFRQANLKQTQFKRCELTGNDYRWSDFSNGQIIKTTFTQSDLSLCTLNQLTLLACSLNSCNFAGVEMKQCHFQDVDFERCSFFYAQMLKSSLGQTQFHHCFFTHAQAYELNLNGEGVMALTRFIKSDFKRCNFGKRQIIQCDFQDCYLDQADFSQAKLFDVRFKGCCAWQMDMSHTQLNHSQLFKNDLRQAKFLNTTFNQTDWHDNTDEQALFAYASANGRRVRCSEAI